MDKSLNNSSSARKKLLEFQEDIKRSQHQESGYLGRNLSKQHSKYMENILRQGLEKQQSDRVIKRQYSTKGYDTKSVKTPSSSKRLDIELTSLNTTKFRPLMTSKSNKFSNNDQIRIQNSAQQNSQQGQVTQSQNGGVPQFFNDTDEVRSARQNQLMSAKRIPFKFSFISYIIQVGIAYGIFIGILYLLQLGYFPYLQLILIFALALTIKPWKSSTIIFFLTTIPITIVNNYMGLASLTYLQILICYLGVLSFNQKHKIKILFILVIVVQIVFGFVILPNIYQGFGNTSIIYYYIFPLFMLILRTSVQFTCWAIGFSQVLFLQIPLFLIGLEYGTILSRSLENIQFWYLIVMFTLQIMNQRTQFILKVLVNLVKFCFPNMNITPTPTPGQAIKNNHILSAHWNGFSSINSFHLIGCVFIFTQLPLYASPYVSSFTLKYTADGQWYKPFIIWVLVSVYQIMCLVLQRNKQNIMLIGHTSNRWYNVLIRGWMLVLGLWSFYMGLGVGQYCITK